MTLAQRPTFGLDDRQTARGLIAVVAAVFALVIAVAAVTILGVMPAPVASGAKAALAAGPAPALTVAPPTPACAAALARARASRTLPGQEAVAASTAMLRACDIEQITRRP